MSRHYTAFLASLLLAACGPSSGPCHDEPWQSLLLDHSLRYPSLEVDDALKLLQQAATGSEHLVTDLATANRRMREELQTLGAGPMEPLVDTLGTDGRFARVHLRPWLARGGSPDTLVSEFVTTASLPPDTASLTCALDLLQRLAVGYRLPWSGEEVRQRVAAWNAGGRPALHHSDAYRERYRPAYRVVAVDRLRRLRRATDTGSP